MTHMANYRESASLTELTQYRRSYQVTVGNPLGGQPWASFHEEDVFTAGEVTHKLPSGQVSRPYNPVDTITLLDPETGAPTGATMSHYDLYRALYSLYIQVAMQRDEQEAAIPTP